MVSIDITTDGETMETKPIKRRYEDPFMSFSLPCDRDTAILQFEERYGCSPKRVYEYKDKYLMLGPTPEREICPGEGGA